MTKRVSIERLRELFRYDPETGKFYQFESRKCGFVPGSEVGHLNSDGYIFLTIDDWYAPAHRVAWAMHYGEWPSARVDHENRDHMDNRLANLRLATAAQNTINAVKANATGRRGVKMCRGKYQAQIKISSQAIHLGTFATLDEAAHAYNKAAIQLHGEFAILNPVGSGASYCRTSRTSITRPTPQSPGANRAQRTNT